MTQPKLDLNKPQFDQNTYSGRAKHFFAVTNPLNLFCSAKQLEESKNVIQRLRNGEDIEGLTEEQMWRHKQIYDSAFHPETGEKMIIIGRMSAQVPMNMAITGCMLTYYKTTSATVFWQWFNQSFNAIVNYTNRSGDSPLPLSQLATSYCLATSGALITALSLNSVTKKAPPLFGRFVPFIAVSAANCVNIPLMRKQELNDGIAIVDENGNRLGHSRIAAKWAIAQVVLSRIAMAAPGMTLPPFFMDYLERRGVLARMPWISAPLQVALCALFLTFTTPMCCALFPQNCSISISSLEPEIQAAVEKMANRPAVGYYNKGL